MPSQAELDQQVYDSLKSLFETLMLRMVDRASKGQDWQTDFDKLCGTFNDQADSNMRLMQRVRKMPAESVDSLG